MAEVQAALPASEDAKLKYRQLENVVDEMSIAAGLPRPKIYIVPDSDPNAFATGRDAPHASIAVTQGLLDTVNRDELQGVIAHELSHVRNLDIRLMTVIAAMVGAAALIADWTSRGLQIGGGSRSRNRETTGEPCGDVWQVQDLETAVVGLRRREAAHLESQGSLDHRGPERG